MSEMVTLMVASLGGALVGGAFYGGLWWTIRRSALAQNRGVWLIGSFALRSLIALGGFYSVLWYDWRSLPVCLLGFLMARIAVTWLTRVPLPKKELSIERVEP